MRRRNGGKLRREECRPDSCDRAPAVHQLTYARVRNDIFEDVIPLYSKCLDLNRPSHPARVAGLIIPKNYFFVHLVESNDTIQ